MATNSYKEVVERAREAFDKQRTLSVEFRRQQLRQLLKMYRENQDLFIDALKTDLRKPRMEAMISEVKLVEGDVKLLLGSLDDLVAPEQVSSVIPLDKSYVLKEPYGVVLVMGAWNYPLQLTMLPVAGAIAAGNCVVIKPSEVAPAIASTIAKLVPQYLDKDCFPVVCGGVPETTQLLQERFDYIFYTGSTTVGRIVREAANKFLTPTTLELGGKSPCYIDSSVDMDLVVRRVLWGKMMNLGQTCVAPDYVLCSRDVQQRFISKAREVLREWYGPNLQQSPDLARIVADRHLERLIGYLSCGEVVVGGGYDRADRWMEPTLLVGVKEDSAIMRDEVFGPILPFVSANTYVDAINIIKRREKPLALYVFTQDREVQQMFIKQVHCGGVCVNDTIMHVANSKLPFGGVGHSGMGAYHGKFTFDTFTHRKSCLVRSYNPIIEKLSKSRFPPYTMSKERMMSMTPQQPMEAPARLLRFLVRQLFSMGLGALVLYVILNCCAHPSLSDSTTP